MSLLAELKRRNVIRVGLFYIVAAWLIIEVAETVLPLFEVPTGVLRGLIVLLVLGVVPVLVFTWVFELTPDGIKRDSELTRHHVAASTQGNKLNWATLIIALVAIGLMVTDRMVPQPTVVPVETTARGVGDASIAVLPFADMSSTGDQEYFSDGMAEEILNALVRVDGLQVASRTSSFGFRGQESLGIPQIADRLGVRHVLEGSVRRAGDNIRVTAQLIDARVDRHLWSETYDRPLTAENVFAIQEEISTAIVAALIASLDIDGVGAVQVVASTSNLTAYDLYLQARALFQARDALDVAERRLAQALEQDETFAKAWELRAAVNGLMKEYGYSELSQDAQWNLAVEYAEQALALDPGSAFALATIAQVESNRAARGTPQRDLADIMQMFERAMALDPHNSSTLNWYGLLSIIVGDLEGGLRLFQRCMVLEPEFGPCASNATDTLYALGRNDAAYRLFQDNLARGLAAGAYVNLPLLAQYEERTAFMLAMNQPLWLFGWRRQADIYEAYRNPNADHSELLAELRDFIARERTEGVGYLGDVLVTLGAYEYVVSGGYVWGPYYRRYRQSPEFKRFIHAAGIHAYWRSAGFPPQCRPRGAEDFECD